MDVSMTLELLAYRALVKLGCKEGYMVSFQAFDAALGKVSLYDGRTMRDEMTFRAALAINSFAGVSRGDYGDTYKSAATVIEMDAMGEPWEERMEERGPSADEAAEVLELMLFDAALSEGEDWAKEDKVERRAAALEAARRARNARRRKRALELKQSSAAAASQKPMRDDVSPSN